MPCTNCSVCRSGGGWGFAAFPRDSLRRANEFVRWFQMGQLPSSLSASLTGGLAEIDSVIVLSLALSRVRWAGSMLPPSSHPFSFSFLSSFFFIASEHFSSPYLPIHSYTHYLAKWCWQSHTKAMKNLRHKVCPCSLHGVLKLNTYCTQYVLTAYLDFSAISPHR